MTQNTEAKNVYQGIALERLIKIDFTTNCRNPNAISVMRNPGDYSGEQPAVLCDFGFRISDFGFVFNDWSKPQRIQAKFWARAHCKDIADNSPNTGGCALKRFNRAGMIVTLHFKRDRPTVADIDDTCIFFAGFDQNIRTSSRKFLQLFFRVLVRAVLAPHYGENSQLGKIWLAAQNFLNALEFFRGEAVLPDKFWGDCWLGSRHLAGHRQIYVNESASPLNHSNKNFR